MTGAAVCLPCWRTELGHLRDDPPVVPGFPKEYCSLCGRYTTAGIYVPGPEELPTKVPSV